MDTAMFYFYLAGVTDAVSGWLVVIFVALLSVLFVLAIGGSVQRCDHNTTHVHDHMVRTSGRWISALIFTIMLSALLPSKEFFYTAAGLKAGEIVVSSELGQKAVDLITHQVDHLLLTYSDSTPGRKLDDE